jgi:hypothetical protein
VSTGKVSLAPVEDVTFNEGELGSILFHFNATNCRPPAPTQKLEGNMGDKDDTDGGDVKEDGAVQLSRIDGQSLRCVVFLSSFNDTRCKCNRTELGKGMK